MRKFLAAAAVAAVATLGLSRHASAQEFYPTTPNVPSRVGGIYGYPSQQYPAYPGEYSTASHKRHDRDERARKDRDRDDRNHDWRNDDRDRNDRGSNYGYGTTAGATGVPSRVGGYSTGPRSTYGDHRWDRNGR